MSSEEPARSWIRRKVAGRSVGTLLLTGATGFLGSWIFDLLGRERAASRLGYDRVRLFVRNPDKARGMSLPDAKVELAQGDLAHIGTVSRAAEGIEAAIHVAALYDMRSKWRDFYRSNVEATGALVRAMPTGSRLVLTSTYGVYGFPVAHDIREDYEPKRPMWHYQKTKKLQEDLARTLCAERGIRFAALRPPTVIGARELFSVPTTIGAILQGRMMLVGGGTNTLRARPRRRQGPPPRAGANRLDRRNLFSLRELPRDLRRVHRRVVHGARRPDGEAKRGPRSRARGGPRGRRAASPGHPPALQQLLHGLRLVGRHPG